MPESSQIKPIPPFQYHIRLDDEDNDQPPSSKTNTPIHKRRAVICLGCCMSGIVLIAALMITLILTIFHIERPVVTVNRVTINTSPSTINITAEIAVKNPNIAAFKYDNSTTWLYYYGDIIDEVHTPSGIAKARRTGHMNVMMGINMSRMVDKIGEGILTVESYTNLRGRVKIAGMLKKNFVVKMNCSFVANVFHQEIMDQNCMSKVSI